MIATYLWVCLCQRMGMSFKSLLPPPPRNADCCECCRFLSRCFSTLYDAKLSLPASGLCASYTSCWTGNTVFLTAGGFMASICSRAQSCVKRFLAFVDFPGIFALHKAWQVLASLAVHVCYGDFPEGQKGLCSNMILPRKGFANGTCLASVKYEGSKC